VPSTVHSQSQIATAHETSLAHGPSCCRTGALTTAAVLSDAAAYTQAPRSPPAYALRSGTASAWGRATDLPTLPPPTNSDAEK
jgi:hypothetical protein